PQDPRAHPAPAPKTPPPAHADETFESPAPYPPAPYRDRPTSETFPPEISRIQNPPPAKTVPAPRNTDPTPAVPPPAARPAHPTNCCQSCSARPRHDSASSAACSPRVRAPPESASRHLHRPDAPPPASAAPSSPAATTPAAAPPSPDPAESPPKFLDTKVPGDQHPAIAQKNSWVAHPFAHFAKGWAFVTKEKKSREGKRTSRRKNASAEVERKRGAGRAAAV